MSHLWTKLQEEYVLSFKFLSGLFIYQLHLKLSDKIQERQLYDKLVQVEQIEDEFDRLCQLIQEDKREIWIITDVSSPGITLYQLDVWISKINEGNLRKLRRLSVRLNL